MEIFDSRYFATNRKMLTLIGLWPYEQVREKVPRRILVGSALIAMSLLHFAGLIVNYDKGKRFLLELIGTVRLVALAAVKIIPSILYENKLSQLYDAITSNWASLVDSMLQSTINTYYKRYFLQLLFTSYASTHESNSDEESENADDSRRDDERRTRGFTGSDARPHSPPRYLSLLARPSVLEYSTRARV